MKVTNQNLFSEQLKSQQKNVREDRVQKESVKPDKQELSEDMLSIARENQKAVDISLESFNQAIEKLNQVKSDINEDPLTALSAQGNIVPESITTLL
jgi:hypothetical protein